MTTIAKRAKAPKNITTKKPAALKAGAHELKPEGIFQWVPDPLIDFSDRNRKIFDPKELQELADNIKLNGVIEPLTLRPLPGGRLEVVAGERRLRASRIAGLSSVPAMIRELTDKQANEIRLSENLQRVNPHPVETAYMVSLMQQDGYIIPEIALRLGKSVSFVYNCIKLAGLITEVQQLFIENKISMQDALGIASLAPETQQEFYAAHLSDPDRTVTNVRYLVDRYKADLTLAPFDTKSKKLLPEAGACTTCPFNSATLKSLFPEMAKEAICTNRNCFQAKCQAHLAAVIQKAAGQQKPDGIILYSNTPEDVLTLIDSLPETAGIQQYYAGDITLVNAPLKPDPDDYMDDWGQDGENEEPALDEEGYQEALQEYEMNLAAFNLKMEGNQYLKGLVISGQNAHLAPFDPEKKAYSGRTEKFTAKALQEAIKAGTATPELVDQEIQRLNDVETRKKEIDREHIQAAVHSAFLENQEKPETAGALTAADQVALRLLVYQSLGYGVQNKVDKLLLPGLESYYRLDPDLLYQALAGLSEPLFAFLIRMALAGKGDSCNPGNVSSLALYKLAEATGTDVPAIEAEQQKLVDMREKRLQERIVENEARKAKLKL